jgi:two-component sensor histidine kinase
MVEPGTIGTLVSRVLGMASEATRQDIASEAAKDAYNALTRKLSCRAASDVDALERNPTSAARRAVIAEAVDQLPEVEKISVKTLATELADTLKPSAAQGQIGIDVRRMDVERDVREIKPRKAETLAM